MQEQSIQLTDGRTLGFASVGERAENPLFYFHGAPGSRLAIVEEDMIAQSLDARLILPERPGYGISTPKPDRQLVDWADDVAELADHLGIETFAVAGESGGGPHALACGFRLPERITSVLLFGSPAPSNIKGATRGMSLGNRLGIVAGKYVPWLLRRMMQGYAPAFHKDPERFLDAMRKQMAPPDQALMQRESVRSALLRDYTEAYRQGSDGHATDCELVMMGRAWGFRLREVAVPVHLWHGEADTLVSRPMMEYLSRELPHGTVHLVPDAGHLLLEYPDVLNAVRDVLKNQGS